MLPFFLNMKLQENISLREHRQKTFVTLSGFWPLRGWGVGESENS